jgi:hypothetical protein
MEIEPVTLHIDEPLLFHLFRDISKTDLFHLTGSKFVMISDLRPFRRHRLMDPTLGSSSSFTHAIRESSFIDSPCQYNSLFGVLQHLLSLQNQMYVSMGYRSSFIFLFLISFSFGSWVNADLTIHYIDVGQGDSALIQSGDKNLLIDAGPYDGGDKVLAYLKKVGVTKLDVVVASHPHSDHIGKMLEVIKAYPPSLYVDYGEVYDNPQYEPLMQYLVKKQIPNSIGKTGKTRPPHLS